MTDYEIKPLSLRCSVTGREMQPGESYYSALTESSDGFVRLDYSVEAWQGPPADAVGFWRSVVPAQAAKKRAMVDSSVILDFFKRIAGDDQPYKVNFRYILALLLLRHKQLKLAGSVREGDHEILVLRSTTGADEYRVQNPELSEQALAAVQAEVEQMLQAGH